jgi:putative hydrolase of the HAD superfamily
MGCADTGIEKLPIPPGGPPPWWDPHPDSAAAARIVIARVKFVPAFVMVFAYTARAGTFHFASTSRNRPPPTLLTRSESRDACHLELRGSLVLRAIFFDLDDTLVDDTISTEECAESVAREVAGGRGLAPADLAKAYLDAAIAFWEGLEPGTSRSRHVGIRRTMWRAALHSLNVDDDALAVALAKRYDAVRAERVEYYPDAVPVLTSLHGRYRLAIITNGFAETHKARIAPLQLGRFFDHVVMAGDLEMVKPDPAVFHYAMGLLGVGPNESIMVGDRFNRDITGAQAAGMRAIWMNVRAEPMPAGANPPDAVIANLSELPAVLAKFS